MCDYNSPLPGCWPGLSVLSSQKYEVFVPPLICPRKCVNSSDAFCYICSEVTFISRRRSSTPLIKKCYENYFSCKVGDQDKSLAPHFCCVTCAKLLAVWAKGSHCMPFAIPMVWREPTDHISDCYFRLASITGVTAKPKHTVQYPTLPSASVVPRE